VNGKAVVATNGQRPPEVRILRISNDAKVFVTFTNEMDFPGNFPEMLNDRDSIASTQENQVKGAQELTDEAQRQGLLSLLILS